MAAEQEWVCPICHDARKDIAYAVPCHHGFCLGCILRWGKQNKSCPLCRKDMEVVKVREWDDDEDLNFIIWPPAPPVPACFQEGVAQSFSSYSPSSSPSLSPLPFSDEEEDEEAEEEEGEEAVEEEDEEDEEEPTAGLLLTETWAQLFRQHPEILAPVLPWLRQRLRTLLGAYWVPAMAAESFIQNALCDVGLNTERLADLIRPVLGDEAEPFMQELVDTTVSQCSQEAHRLLGLQGTHVSGGQEEGPAAGGQEDSRVAAPGPAASPQVTLPSNPGLFGHSSTSIREEQPSTAGADIPAEYEQMVPAAAAAPSAQGSSPSSPGHSPEGARRPPKRKVDGDQDSQPPCKRPTPLRGAQVSVGQEEGPAARGQEDSRVAAPGPAASPQVTLPASPGLFGSPSTSIREEQPGTAGADIRAGPSHGPAAHTAREAERPHEEMEPAAAAAPSAQGSSPSDPGQSPERARRAPKRSADCDQDPQPPCKRPPPRWD